MAHQLLRTHCPAETPAGHRIGLGETVHNNGALFHAVQLRKADVAIRTVGQAVVNLIGQHNDIRVLDDRCNRLQLIARHDRAGRVVRVRQDEQLGARRNSGAQTVRRQLELVLRAGRQRHRNTARHLRQRLVAYKARLRNQHLVPHIDNRTDGVVDRLGAADRHKDLLVRIVAQAVLAAHERGNLIAQLGKTPVGGVEGLSFFQRLNAGAANLPRRFKIRLAHTE